MYVYIYMYKVTFERFSIALYAKKINIYIYAFEQIFLIQALIQIYIQYVYHLNRYTGAYFVKVSQILCIYIYIYIYIYMISCIFLFIRL